MASPGDVGTANSYGLECQANVVNYAQDGWYQADLTREEFLAEMERTRTAGVAGAGGWGWRRRRGGSRCGPLPPARPSSPGTSSCLLSYGPPPHRRTCPGT